MWHVVMHCQHTWVATVAEYPAYVTAQDACSCLPCLPMLIYRTQQPGDTPMTSYFSAYLMHADLDHKRSPVIDDKLISSPIPKIAATLAPGCI